MHTSAFSDSRPACLEFAAFSAYAETERREVRKELRSRTICIIFLFLSILMVLASAETAEAMTWTVQLTAVVGGPSQMLRGVKLTANNYVTTATCPTTPCLMELPEGQWTFTAPISATVSGVKYNFVKWTDEEGNLFSVSNSFTWGIYSSRNFDAVYAQAQSPRTTLPQSYKPPTTSGPTTPSTSCGYIEIMMGQCPSYSPYSQQGYQPSTTPVSNSYGGNTVHLSVDLGGTSVQTYVFNVYIDGVYVGQTNIYGDLDIGNVASGYHTFSLKNSWGTFVTDPIFIPNYDFTLNLMLVYTYQKP